MIWVAKAALVLALVAVFGQPATFLTLEVERIGAIGLPRPVVGLFAVLLLSTSAVLAIIRGRQARLASGVSLLFLVDIAVAQLLTAGLATLLGATGFAQVSSTVVTLVAGGLTLAILSARRRATTSGSDRARGYEQTYWTYPSPAGDRNASAGAPPTGTRVRQPPVAPVTEAMLARRTLGVSISASDVEVRAAYLHLAKVHHPDAGGDAAAFRRVRSAYELLTGDAGTKGCRR